jgi:hypothetical protein
MTEAETANVPAAVRPRTDACPSCWRGDVVLVVDTSVMNVSIPAVVDGSALT